LKIEKGAVDRKSLPLENGKTSLSIGIRIKIPMD